MNQQKQLGSILLQSSNCYFVSLDDKENITSYNKAFQKLFGDKPLQEVHFPALLPGHLIKHWRHTISQLNKNESTPGSFIGHIGPTQVVNWEIAAYDIDSKLTYELIGTPVTSAGQSENELQLKWLVNDLEKIMSSSLDIICTIDEEGRFITISEASKYILGYTPRELIGQYYLKLAHPFDVGRTIRAAEKIKQGYDSKDLENRFVHKDGRLIPLMWSMKWDSVDKRFYGVGRDVTDKKKSEQELLDSEGKYKLLFYKNPLPMWIFELETLRFLEVNEAATESYGFSREEFLQMTILELRPDEEKQRLLQLHKLQGLNTPVHQGYWVHSKKDGTLMQVEITAHQLDYEGKRAKLVLASDRTQQVLAEQEIIRTNERYSYVSKATFNVVWDWDLQLDIIEWNDIAVEMFGYTSEEIGDVKWWQKHLHPDDRERVVTNLQRHINDRHHHWEDEYRFTCADGSYKHIFDRGFIIYDENKTPLRMLGAMQDVSDLKSNELKLKELNFSLEKRARELAESNAELERFAYVASHDLQEPLRMVSSFLQLLEKRYKEKLDVKAHEYIAFAVDGAERMKGLILDLLEYSRVNTSKEEREKVETNKIIEEVRLTYNNVLQETNGEIICDDLPNVHGTRTQVMQLFQNIISNALKYRSAEPPIINITYKKAGNYIEFAISDNGIGIDERFFHKIFIIFQRLHNREHYSGTGIGLAICKKIVERHGGKIWLTSTPGKGSTFYFTLPQ
ncbi:PAS domain-containing sensor histidine kinase [Aridibaculum aurantiacum]|uniref:PAS domain-containing sensor histidine kinase n=1 Tax=Aridibaculum aurantiacum TaxID=2810307 RepID=UPI001A966EE3|nr:PAS domain S-box protein [Aridibaculum aurantiacum]